MANSFTVRLAEPRLASLIFALVQDVVVRELGNGVHSTICYVRDPDHYNSILGGW